MIGLKANQGNFHEQISAHFARVSPSLSSQISRDLGHGRAEKRVIRISEDVQWLDAMEDFVGLRSVVCVESSRWVNEKEEFSTRFYISSLSGVSAAQMGHYIRRHRIGL